MNGVGVGDYGEEWAEVDSIAKFQTKRYDGFSCSRSIFPLAPFVCALQFQSCLFHCY